jgi:prepilin-type N-terminal cleavage/methylation domain-containing protein
VSRFVDHVAAARPRRDDGFSLVEMIVALGIISIVVTALLPQLVVGIRSTGVARTVTQAKGVAQGQLEQMRNLPFHISPAAGDYRDVLDFYYRDLTVPSTTPICEVGGAYADPSAGWTGFVPDGGTRCDYEPPGGAMYRSVLPDLVQGFRVVVSTQFLAGTLPATDGAPPAAITPPAGYDTQVTGKDRPPASQIGVTVTVLSDERGALRPVTAYTQIAEQPSNVNRIRASTNATALELGSVTKADGAVSLSTGLLNLVGSLTYASTAGATLAATSAGLATGDQESGASSTLSVPPSDLEPASKTEEPEALNTAGCSLVCWGQTQADKGPISSEGGLPNVGSATYPMQSLLRDSANFGISFQNSATTDYRPSLLLDGPLARVHVDAVPTATGVTSSCTPGANGSTAHVASSGFIRTTDVAAATEPSTVEACALARANTISILPTTFAPRGILQVELTRASTVCKVAGAAHTASADYDYRAVVRYRDPSAADGYSVAGTIIPGLTNDPLDDVPMTTPVGQDRVLGDYVESWSGLLAPEVTPTASGGIAAVTLPGVVTITTRPVRTGTDAAVPAAGSTTDPPATEQVDLSSVVSLTFGAMGCSAEDAR